MTTHSTFIPARPTTYRGIKMRSRLEATFAAKLDGFGLDWQYEPRCFAGTHGQYLPDFSIESPSGIWYVEVKPSVFVDGAMETLERMPTIWESEPDAGVALASPVLGDLLIGSRGFNDNVALLIIGGPGIGPISTDSSRGIVGFAGMTEWGLHSVGWGY